LIIAHKVMALALANSITLAITSMINYCHWEALTGFAW
jgi:hypothetical protein